MHPDPDAPASKLPRLLAALREHFGEEAALSVSRELGGRRVYLPRRASASHPLARRIGADVLGWLVDRYGGGACVKVPLGPKSQRARLPRRIDKLLRAGFSPREVAARLGCDVRTVHAHRSRAAAGPSGGSRAAADTDE